MREGWAGRELTLIGRIYLATTTRAMDVVVVSQNAGFQAARTRSLLLLGLGVKNPSPASSLLAKQQPTAPPQRRPGGV